MLCLESLLAGHLHLRLSLAISSCDNHPSVKAILQEDLADHMHQVLCKRVLAPVPQQLSSALVVDEHEMTHLDTGDDGLRQDCLQDVHGL